MKCNANKKSMKPIRKMTGKAMRNHKGGVSFGDIVITKTVDKSSPTLML